MSIFRTCVLIALIVSAPAWSSAGEIFSFEGEVDLDTHEFTMAVDLGEGSSATATARRMSETNYRLSLDFDHVRTPFFELLSRIEGSLDVSREQGKSGLLSTPLQGKVWSRYSLVDFKPINELSGRFEIKDQQLHVRTLSVGNLACEGSIDLTPPYELDVVLNLSGVGMEDFLNFWRPGKAYDASGTVFGEIRVSGPPGQLVLKGSLEGRDGFVEQFDFNTIRLNAEGVYPMMRITHSSVSRMDGVSFSLDGTIDLSDRDDFKKQVKALTLAPLVSDSGSQLEWTIKRLTPEPLSTTEFKYFFKKSDALGNGPVPVDEIDMLGIERTRKF